MNWYKTSNEKKLIVMRGISGAGKSTLARELGQGGVVLSTDDFFTTPEGEYQFNVRKLGEAHKWNQNRAEQAMEKGISPIVIDNTNVRVHEAKNYVIAAQKHGYNVEIAEPNWSPELRTPEGKWNIDFINELQKRRNINNKTKIIPQDVVKRMVDQYDYDITVDDILKSKAPWEK